MVYNKIMLGLLNVVPHLIKGLKGGLGGAVKSVLTSAGVNIDGDNPEKGLKNYIKQATPEQLAAIKAADNNFKLEMEKMGIDLAQIAAEDRKNARAMQVKTRTKLVPFLALFIIMACFSLPSFLFFKDMPTENRDLINNLFYLLVGYAGNVVTFYFGSSDEKNNDLVDRM